MASSTSMAPIIFLVLCLSFSFSLHHVVVEGTGRYFSRKQQDEDLELERQLTILNKPPIKTIQTEEGDTFDCIDIHKQPAFDNPLLKNHKIQIPKSQSKELSPSANLLSKILKRIDCPQGTVPIRRTSKEDLIRAKYFSQPKSFHLLSSEHPGEHESYMISAFNTSTFYGVRGQINIASPTVGNNQYSGAQIWVGGGDSGGGEFNTIQAGWGVSPSLFGDSRPRVIVYWSADALHKEGCYNQFCTGFVQVDKEYTVGSVLTEVSQFKGNQYSIKISIYQDNQSGDWWLQGGDEEKKIGYWPKSLFNHLNNGASQVAWGGIVKGTSNGPSPQMGNGHYPNKNYNEACSVTNMEVQKDARDWFFDENYFQFKNDWGLITCYNIEYDGEVTKSQGYSLLFGGPGGNNCGF